MPKYEITSPDGQTYEVNAPKGASEQDAIQYVQSQIALVPDLVQGEQAGSLSLDQKKQLVDLRKSGFAPKIYRPTEAELGERTAKELGGVEKFRAGAGKAFVDLARGAQQISGLGDQEALQQTIEEAKQRDPGLMTGAGFAGNVAGNIASFLPAMFVPGVNTYAGAAAMGAGMGALQPTAEGDSRLLNTGLGAAGGLAGQAGGRLLGSAFKGAGAVASPFMKKGREKIVGRFLRDQLGNNADDVINKLNSAKTLVPGTQPLTRDVADHAALSRITQGLQSKHNDFGQTMKNILRSNNQARLEALQGVIPDEAAATSLRRSTTKQLLRPLKSHHMTKSQGAAMVKPVEKLLSTMKRSKSGQTMGPILDDISARLKTVASSRQLNKAEKLYGVRDYVSKQLKASPENSPLSHELDVIMRKIDGQIRRNVPEYGAYMSGYRELSKPINQAKVLNDLIRKSTSPVDDSIRPASFAKNVRDDKQFVKLATGFKRNKGLAGTLTPEQNTVVQNVLKDVKRASLAQNAGKIPGSNTAQDLATQNLLRRAGIPDALADNPLARTLSRPVNFAYKVPEEMTQDVLAKAMTNPQYAAKLMADAKVPQSIKNEIAKALIGAGGLSVPAGLLANP